MEDLSKQEPKTETKKKPESSTELTSDKENGKEPDASTIDTSNQEKKKKPESSTELTSDKEKILIEGDETQSCLHCEKYELEQKRLPELESNKKELDKVRLAPEMAVSIKTEDIESMNNPVSKAKLYEMYHKLRLLQWPKVKDLLKSTKVNPEVFETLIQVIFKEASHEMEKCKKLIQATLCEVMEVTESSELTPQKIKKCKQLVIQKHQLFLYHNRKDLKKTLLFELDTQYSKDVVVKLRAFASECYWLSCLLALNNPPLQPDWDNKFKGMDPWDIFPQEINILSFI